MHQNNTTELLYMNYSKGIAILLVVFGHIFEILNISEPYYSRVWMLYYTTHVPTFFLISGYLFSHSLRHRDISYKIKQILNAFLISILWITIYIAFYSFFEIKLDSFNINNILFTSINNLWYILVLNISFVVLLIIRRLNLTNYIFIYILFFCVSFCSFFSIFIAKLIISFTLIYIGYYCEHNNKKIISYYNPLIWITIIIYSIYTNITMNDVLMNNYLFIIMQAGKLFGCFVIPFISFRISIYIKEIKFLKYIGQNTLAIYISHFIPLYFFKIFSPKTIYMGILCLILCIIFPLSGSIVLKNFKKCLCHHIKI